MLFPLNLLAVYFRHIRGKMKCPPSHSALNPTHNHTLIGYNPHIDLISHLHVIYILFTGKQDFKFLVMGFLALLGTFQAPGHLILGPSNTFHEKGTRYQRNFKFRREWRKMHQVHMKHDRPCISEYTVTQVFPEFDVSQINCCFSSEKGSLGPGVDAPELEMSQRVSGTLNQEL